MDISYKLRDIEEIFLGKQYDSFLNECCLESICQCAKETFPNHSTGLSICMTNER